MISEDSFEPFDFADILRARWLQMLEYFEIEDEIDAIANTIETVNEDTDTPVAEQMFERVRETIEKQPQLSPFIVPVANKAINDAAESVSKIKGLEINPDNLQKDFFKHWKDWMLT